MIETRTLKEYEDLRKNVSFHFTPMQNLDNILENGLVSNFGDNSTGILGQSAIPKVYISYGLEGVMQLYNRILNLSQEGALEHFQGASHKPFIPKNLQGNDMNYKMNIIEGFEFVRQYMENNRYFIIDSEMSRYEHTLSDEELSEINENILTLETNSHENLVQKIKSLNKEIERLSTQGSEASKDELAQLYEERNGLAIEAYKISQKVVQTKQGKLLNKDSNLVLDTIDFNDERLRWTNFEKNPHNTHTRIEEFDGKLAGVSIKPETMHAFSKDGKTYGTGLDFIQEMYGFVKDTDQINIQAINCVDANLIPLFCEYIKMVEQYKQMGLLEERPEITIKSRDKEITIPSSLVMNLSDISKYPNLDEFKDKAESYYENELSKRKEIREQIKNAEKAKSKNPASKDLLRSFTKDSKVALLDEEARKNNERLAEETTKQTDDKDIGEQ